MPENLVGRQYGRLTVKEYHGKIGRLPSWVCECSCGNLKTVPAIYLKTGDTKSCGCLKHEAPHNRTHGLSKTSFAEKFHGAKARCTNENLPVYHYYGGRGIKFCWNDLQEFAKDMFATYTEGASLERVDVNGNYCKENCAWVDFKDQARNHRMQCNNTSGVVGVMWVNMKSRGNTCAVASWQEFGKEQRVSFSVKKLGLIPAFAAAVEYREQQLDRLERQGIVFGEHHRCRVPSAEGMPVLVPMKL